MTRVTLSIRSLFMVQRVAAASGERAPKRQKKEHNGSSSSNTLKTGDDIRKALSSQSPEVLKNSTQSQAPVDHIDESII